MLRQLLRPLLPLLFSCMLLVLPYAEVHAAPVQQQSATSYQGIVNSTANIRSGPGLEYPVVGQARDGQIVTVTACNQDCSWLQLDTGNWIAAFLVDLVVSPDSSGSGRRENRLIDPEDVVIGEPSQAALEIVEQILSYTGLPQSFDVYSANIYNAAAAMVDGKRVILYDPQLITDIESVTNHNWPAVSILAHEIGHHLAGHTLADEFVVEFELEADYFSGFILNKMGATLEEAQSVMSLLRDHPNMQDHPPQAERLAAIEDGWQEAARQTGVAAWEPPLTTSEEVSTNLSDRYAPSIVDISRAVQTLNASYLPSSKEIEPWLKSDSIRFTTVSMLGMCSSQTVKTISASTSK
jgi:hypothetical protein